MQSNFALKPRPPGTEFLDVETGRQKSPLKCANARRDQNPGSEWPEIPAETPYSESYRKRAVCEDWMVVCAVKYEPVSTSNVSGFLQGIFANCCLLSENAGEFTASIQSLANSFPKNRNRRLEAANRVSWLIIRAEHNLEQATLTQGSKARNPAPHFTW